MEAIENQIKECTHHVKRCDRASKEKRTMYIKEYLRMRKYKKILRSSDAPSINLTDLAK